MRYFPTPVGFTDETNWTRYDLERAKHIACQINPLRGKIKGQVINQGKKVGVNLVKISVDYMVSGGKATR